jgi:DNA polymerase-3 subunit epsilon
MWWTGGALGFDLETDSADPLDARIITCGMVDLARSGDSAVHDEMELMLQPERDIPAAATAIHHITTQQAMRDGALREVGIAQIVATIGELAGEYRPLVGHNVSYDLTVLDREMRRTGIGRLATVADDFGSLGQVWIVPVSGDRLGPIPVIDTFVLDKAIDKYRPGKRQLSFVAAHYGVPMAEGSAHGATADVIACLRIAIVIAGRTQWDMDDLLACYRDRRKPFEVAAALQELGGIELAELHVRQQRWAGEQAMGLRDHFLRHPDKGDAKSVDGRWPIRPLDQDETVETVDTQLI